MQTFRKRRAGLSATAGLSSFSSYQLTEQLYSRGIYATATVRANRSDLPVMARSRPTLERDEFKWRSRNNTAYVIWRDTKDVHVLTTAFAPSDAVQVNVFYVHCLVCVLGCNVSCCILWQISIMQWRMGEGHVSLSPLANLEEKIALHVIAILIYL